MTKQFNWNYKPAHPVAGSHVRDAKTSNYATFTGQPDPLDTPVSTKRLRGHQFNKGLSS